MRQEPPTGLARRFHRFWNSRWGVLDPPQNRRVRHRSASFSRHADHGIAALRILRIEVR